MPRVSIPIEQRFWTKIDKDGDIHPKLKTKCWKWLGATKEGGYGIMGKGSRKDGLIKSTHVSWMIHNGSYPDKWVLHSCDNPNCCNPKHLFLGDNKDNVQDCLQKGRTILPSPRYGLDNYLGKLSNEQVLEIREILANIQLPPKRHGRVKILTNLADRFGISLTHLRDIKNKKVRT